MGNKEPLLSELENFFQALSDKTRLEIVLSLLEGEKNVQELSASLGKSQSLISHHLACLRNCGAVKVRKVGKFVYYSIADDHVKDILSQAIDHVSEYSKSILSCEIVSQEKGQGVKAEQTETR
ncbi:MAG: metalloregulator ArsR/SmtB family transcription factor [Candidatus Aramenus sp.]|jgi:DNA-binding transcriptional ArsR family regulator|nr:metalloregulator ArsR/SmtB family transcription factor [Candidatus Aramenus sp.]